MLAALAIAIASICLIPLTNINSDMSRYLPDDSQMKQGIDKMAEEFGDDGLGSGMVRVMFKSLPDSARNAVKDELSDIEGVANVIYIEGSDEYNHGEMVLYELLGNSKRSQHELADDISSRYGDIVIVETSEQDTTAPLGVMLIAFALLLAVLLIMCESWLEPPIFLAAIGVAVAINMGTNALLESVSATTNSIAAILQLVLSIDYSIILMNRYRQEKESGKDKIEAMSNALNKASSSIVSSAFTTIVGLLALLFMKLKIGADMGIVLAKGVLCSLVAIFTVLPSLIIMLDSAIEKSKKRVLNFHTERLAGFSMKFRIPLAILFVVIFAGSYWLHKKTDISFSIEQKSEIAKTFPQRNITALLYKNSDSLEIIKLADSISKNQHIKSFVSYPSLMQKKYSAQETKGLLDEMTSMTGDLDINEISSEQIVNTIYHIKSGELANEKISLHDFALLLSDFATDTTYTTDIDIPIS
ncbi:MAG: MMPL family transporter, partial [Bacteroidales bacterium]|nr:MMPL family transporter [Bacteroidales bacterium]